MVDEQNKIHLHVDEAIQGADGADCFCLFL